MEILIIGGFLGAGKTTTLAQIAGYLTHTMHDQVVILENEISDTGVDDQLLTRSGFQVKEMLAGCICCSSSAQLTDTIKEIENLYHPKWLIIEATGLAYPDAIWDTIHTEFQIDAKIITLLDASRWMRLQKAMPQFADAQLTRADVIIINKTDLAPYVHASLEVMREDSERMRPGKPFLFTNCMTGEGIAELVGLICRMALFDVVPEAEEAL